MLIGLAGPARVGKDTIGNLLPGPRFAFADALKDEACEIGGIDRATLDADKIEIRFFLEALGAFHRKYDPEHWIKKVRRQWEALHGGIAKITDVRHFNEAEWINRAGGLVIFLHRRGVEPASPHEAANLDSIRDLPYVHHVDNDETPEHTARKVMQIIASAESNKETPSWSVESEQPKSQTQPSPHHPELSLT